jgi:hypothetical protein
MDGRLLELRQWVGERGTGDKRKREGEGEFHRTDRSKPPAARQQTGRCVRHGGGKEMAGVVRSS